MLVQKSTTIHAAEGSWHSHTGSCWLAGGALCCCEAAMSEVPERDPSSPAAGASCTMRAGRSSLRFSSASPCSRSRSRRASTHDTGQGHAWPAAKGGEQLQDVVPGPRLQVGHGRGVHSTWLREGEGEGPCAKDRSSLHKGGKKEEERESKKEKSTKVGRSKPEREGKGEGVGGEEGPSK